MRRTSHSEIKTYYESYWTPSFVSSSTSVCPVKRYYGKQDPWRSVVAEDRSGQPEKETESFSSTDYSKLDYDCAWSSQEWKDEVTTHDRSGRPDKTSWRMVRQKRMSNAAGEGEEHFYNLVNVYGCDDECSDIHGKEFPRQSEFHYEHIRSHTEENVRHICKIGERTR